MTTQQNSVITTNSDIDLDNFLVTVEDNQDVIIIDTCKNRIGVNTIDPSYSIDVRSRQDISGTIYTSCLKTGNIISSLIPHTDNPDMSHNLGSTNKSWKRIDASYIEISGVTIKDANQFTIGEGSGGSGIVFPSDISINGDMCCNNIAVDGITINDANKFSIGEATNQSGITFPLDISINGNLTVTGTVNSTYLESLAQNTETELQYQFDNFRTDGKIIAYNIDVSNIDIKENILFNNIAPKQDETVVYDGNNIKWKTRGENLVNYVENNMVEKLYDVYSNSDASLIGIFNGNYSNAQLHSCDINNDGTVIAIGYYRNENTYNKGLVQVYDLSTNGSWIQKGSDISGAETDSHLGEIVRIAKTNSNRLVIKSSNPDAAIIYDFSNGDWVKHNTVLSPSSNEIADICISDDGNRIIASDIDSNNTGTISVYDFSLISNDWDKDTIIDSGSGLGGNGAGKSLSMSSNGNKFIYGIPEWGSGVLGTARIFEYANNSWSSSELGNYQSGSNGERMGTSVAMSGDGKTIAVGLPFRTTQSQSEAGRVRIYYLDTDNKYYLYSSGDICIDPEYQGFFGNGRNTIALNYNGSRIIIGAPYYNNNGATNNGEVYIIEKNVLTNQWLSTSNVNNFISLDLNSTDNDSLFGHSVAISNTGNTIIATALKQDTETYTDAGRAVVYKLPNALEDNTIFYTNDDYKLRYFNPPIRQPPTITLLGDVSMSLSTSQVYIEPGAVATDYRGAILDVNIQGDTVSENPGKYIIEYNTTDYTGVTQYVFRNVIRDNTPFTRYIKSAQTTYGDLYLNLLTPHSQFSIDNYQGDDYDGILKTGPNPQIFKFVPVNAGFKITSNDLSGVGKFLGTANSQNLGHLLTLLDQDDSDVVTFTNIDLDSIGNIRFNISLDSGTFPTTYSIGSSHFDSAIVTDVFQITTINSDTSETKQLFNLLTTLPDYGFPTYRYIKSAQTTYGDMYLNLGDQMRPESYSYWLNTYGNNVNLTVYYKSLKIGTLPQLFKFVPVNGGFKITTAYGDGEGKFLGTSEERKEPNGNPAGHLLTLVDQNSPSVLIFTNIDLYNTSAINLKFKTHGMNFYGRTYYSGEGHFDFADYGDMLQLVETASGDNKNKVQILETL